MSEKKEQSTELEQAAKAMPHEMTESELEQAAKVMPHEMTESEMEQAARDTGAALAAEPKVRIKIPNDPLNKGDGVVPVCVNGYHYQIKRGETVEVPQTVADILERAKYI